MHRFTRPWKASGGNYNFASGQLAAESVNEDLVIKLCSEFMNKFQSTLPHGFAKKVSKTVVTQSEGKNI